MTSEITTPAANAELVDDVMLVLTEAAAEVVKSVT